MILIREVTPEAVAEHYHEQYEKLAPEFGWKTQVASRKKWPEVPEPNRKLMVAAATKLLEWLQG
jgi:hypothetical protein